MILLSLMCLEIVFRVRCSMIIPGTELRLKSLQFPGFSFLPFLKMGVIFAFLKSLGTHHD